VESNVDDFEPFPCKSFPELLRSRADQNVGVSLQTLHDRGGMSVWERILYLVNPGTFCPLRSIFDPENEESGSPGVVEISSLIGIYGCHPLFLTIG
jgi:acetyl-CoA carboxylase carboxyltransferase component